MEKKGETTGERAKGTSKFLDGDAEHTFHSPEFASIDLG